MAPLIFEVSLIILIVSLITMILRVFLILPIKYRKYYGGKTWIDYLLLWLSIITGFGVCYTMIFIDGKNLGLIVAVLLIAMIILIWEGVNYE